MGQEQFAAIMPYISADLVGMIAKKKNISETDGNTARICYICFLSRKKKREKSNFPMCKEEQP